VIDVHPNQIDVMEHYGVCCPAVAVRVGGIVGEIVGGDFDMESLVERCEEISAVIRMNMNGEEDFHGPLPTPEFILMWCVADATMRISNELLRALEDLEC